MAIVEILYDRGSEQLHQSSRPTRRIFPTWLKERPSLPVDSYKFRIQDVFLLGGLGRSIVREHSRIVQLAR